MIVVGVAFLLFAALVQFLSLNVVNTALVTGVVFVLLGLIFGDRWPYRK